jgi:peroxiredoxin
MLSANQQAPQFAADTVNGRRIDLAELCAGGRVLMKFHRFSGCPIAQHQIRALLAHHEELRTAGIETVVILHNAPEKVRGVFHDAPGVHIVADREKRLYREYDVHFAWRRMLSPGTWAQTLRSVGRGNLPRVSRFQGGVVGVPADFLIDRSGQILSLSYGRHYGDSWSAADALAAVRAAGPRGWRASEARGWRASEARGWRASEPPAPTAT